MMKNTKGLIPQVVFPQISRATKPMVGMMPNAKHLHRNHLMFGVSGVSRGVLRGSRLLWVLRCFKGPELKLNDDLKMNFRHPSVFCVHRGRMQLVSTCCIKWK